ncbi:MAG: hypothetical protein WDW19_06180, partial [Neisseriaceae bacterium]
TLREKHFHGLPEKVMNYFKFLAQDVREWLARLGVRKLTELIGRTDLLEVVEGGYAKTNRLDRRPLLYQSKCGKQACHCIHLKLPFDKGN